MNWLKPLVTGTLLVLVALSSHWSFPADGYSAGLCLGALALDLTAVSLPFGGRFSCSWVPLLALANGLHDGGGVALACGSLGLGLRRLRPPSEAPGLGLTLLGVGCLCANLWQSSIVGCLLSMLAYHLLDEVWSRRRARAQLRADWLETWLRLQNTLHEVRWPGLLACLAFSQAEPLGWWTLALVGPLIGTQRAVANSIFRLQARQAQQAIEQARELQHQLQQSYRAYQDSHQQLEISQNERAWLQSLTRTLSAEQQPYQQLLRLFSDHLRGFHSWALLQGPAVQAAPWQLLANLGPALPLQRLDSSLVADCWTSQNPRLLSQPEAALVAGQTTAVALPLGPLVLYVGRSGAPLTPEEGQRLIHMAAQAGPLLTPRVQNQYLHQQVTALQQLQLASQRLSGLVDEGAILQALPELCQSLAPLAAGRVWLTRLQPPALQWGQLPKPIEQALHECLSRQQLLLTPGGGPFYLPLGGKLGVIELIGQAGSEQLEALSLLARHVGLALSQLQHQQARLQASKIAAITQLAAGVAHELNTPMGAISLSLEGLAASPESPGNPKKIERAARALERCRSIVSQLMVYTRISSPEGPPVDLSGLVSDTLELFRSPLGLERYHLETSWAEALPVRVSPQELQQLVVNLLSNALESYPADQPGWVGVATQRSGPWACLEVADRGCGMQPEQLARAVDPFYTTKKIGENVGLGLTVASELARHYGGQLELGSTPNEGTRARLRLPLSEG